MIRAMNDPFDRSFRDRTLAGETLLGLFLDLGSPASADVCAVAGYDWLLVDLEHGAATEADLPGLLRAVDLGGPTALVRPQSGERIRIGRALDVGARGIMVPRLDSADQAREAVTYLRYPPDGIRGVATRVRGAGLGVVGHADVKRLNERVVGIIQIESVGGLRDADAIAAIDGVDVLFVGPLDLSYALGAPGDLTTPAFQAALQRVLHAAQGAGKAAGYLVPDGAIAARMAQEGWQFLAVGSDTTLLAAAVSGHLRTAREAHG